MRTLTSIFALIFTFALWPNTAVSVEVPLAQPQALAVEILSMDPTGRQIDFKFSAPVIPTLEELRAAQDRRAQAAEAPAPGEPSLREKLRQIKAGVLGAKDASADIQDDAMDHYLGALKLTDEDYPAAVEKIKAYITSKISFAPEVQGTFVWTGAQGLSYVLAPRPPEEWGWQISVQVEPIHPYFGKAYASQTVRHALAPAMASKSVNWSPIKGSPRLVSHLGYAHYANYIGQGPYFLLYDQEPGLKRIKKHLQLKKADGSPVAFSVLQSADSGGAFSDKQFDFKRVVAVKVDEPLTEGQALLISIPSWEEGVPAEQPSLRTLSLLYRGGFKLLETTQEGARRSGRMELKSSYTLKFSSGFGLDGFRRALELSPQPKDLIVRPRGDDAVDLLLELNPGVAYRVALGKGFTDSLGNPLSEPVELTFTAQDLKPSLVVPAKPLVLEPEHAAIPFKGANLDAVEVHVYEFASAADYIKALARKVRPNTAAKHGLTQKVLSFRKDLSKVEMNAELPDSIVLDQAHLKSPDGDGKPGSLRRGLPEGFKCLELLGVGRGSEKSDLRRTLLTDVSSIGITAKISRDEVLVWLASFADSKVLAKTPVQLLDAQGVQLGEAVSDADGIAVIKPTQKGALGGKKTFYLVAGGSSIMPLRNDELSSAWQFKLPTAAAGRPLKGSIFTERGVYRPGEKVYVKAYAYAEGDSRLSLVVKDPRSKEVFRAAMKPDDYGSDDFKFDVPEGGAVGDYNIILSNGSSTLTKQFKVEEYRVPTFLVSLDDGGKDWVIREGVEVGVLAKYYHGGSMGDREFRWQLSRTFAPFLLKDLPGYVFQGPADETASGIVGGGEGTLNAEGKMSVGFKPDHDVAAGRMNYTLEAVVTDHDRQAYSSRLSKLVSPAGIYVGVKPPAKEVVPAQTKLKIPVVVVDPAGKLLKGVSVDIQVERIEHHQSARQFGDFRVQMLNRMVGSLAAAKTLRSGSAPVDFEYTPAAAGIYRFNFNATDAKGAKVRTSTYLLVSGDEPIAWPRFDFERIELVLDKTAYKVGETAHLVPQSPYRRATALLSVEVDGVMSTRVVSLRSDTPEIKVPILAAYAPNAFVSLVLLRGREHTKTDALGFETGAPGFKIGYANLVVDPADKRLRVEIDRSLVQVSPKAKVSIPVRVKDQAGAGAPAQLTAMVVDEAVLAMTGYRTPDPVDEVYKQRGLAVRTGANWLDLPHSRRERLEALFPAGDAETGINGRSDLSAVLRNLFKSTAYFKPDLLTDAEGKATLSFTMPDSLTTYRVMVVAADKQQRFGSDEHALTSQQPLMLQPVLPRFVHPEDELRVEAMVFNNTGRAVSVQLRAEFQGLSLAAGDKAEKTVEIAARKSAGVPFQVKAGPAGSAVVRFSAATATHKDAGEYKLPVRDPGTSQTQLASAKLAEGGQAVLTLPEHFVPGTLKAQLVLSVTELTELQGAVQYLMGYPNGCIEQTTSMAYPLVVLKDLLPAIGVEVDKGKLKEFSEAGVKRILNFQTSAGGLSYWPGGTEPHAFATAFGLTALIAAKQRGYDVPAKALAGMADYLETVMRSGTITGEMPHGSMADADTRALFVMTLGRLGRPQPQSINALWEKRQAMTGFGLSFLAVAVKEQTGGDQSLLEPILQAIKDASTQEKDLAYFGGQAKGGYSLDSPLRTHAASLIAYGKSGKDAAMNGKLMNGFLARQRGGLWGNTQENVFGIMGILESVGRSSGKGVPDAKLLLNGKPVPLASMEAPDNRVRRLDYTEAELGLAPGAELKAEVQGPVQGGILSLRLNYDVPLEHADLSAKAAGFGYDRVYETVEGGPVDLQALPLGGLLRVRLKVRAEQNYNYVAIDDKLPAGLEPLNTELATTEKVAQGELSQAAQKGLAVLSYQEIRDHRVAFFADELLAGDYEFSYVARATTPGSFLRPAAKVEAMYDPDRFARTEADEVIVK